MICEGIIILWSLGNQSVTDILTKMAIDPSLAETDIFDEVLKYGLFLGAIFQLVCIGAVMFVPSRDDRRVSQLRNVRWGEHFHRGHFQNALFFFIYHAV